MAENIPLKPTSHRAASLYIYLQEKGFTSEQLSVIRDFYRKRDLERESKQVCSKYDNDTHWPMGRYRRHSINDPSIPRKYIAWIFTRPEFKTTYPIFMNTLTKKYGHLRRSKGGEVSEKDGMERLLKDIEKGKAKDYSDIL